MSVPRMRPTFELLLPGSAEDVRNRLRDHLSRDGCPTVHQLAGYHMTVTVPRETRHFWSPWLWLEVSPHDGGAARIFGRFSPHPSVWTGVMLCQLSLIVIASLAAMFAAAQATLRQPPSALWAVPIAGALMLIVYWFSLVGQRLAHDQMELLRQEIDEAIGAAGAAAAPAPDAT